MTNVLLVDENSKYLQESLPYYGYEVSTAIDENQALKVLEKDANNIDIVLMDTMKPNKDSIRSLKTMCSLYKDVPVIMLTSVNEDQKMIACLKNGADDYIVKPFILPNLLARMEAVLRRSVRHKNSPTNIIKTTLTAKEKEVLKYASKGLSNREIAEKMVVREVTIKTHLNSIFKKLKVSNRTQAVLLAMQAEIV